MDSRGEAIARGASEADHRQPRGTAVELRDEGRPASRVGHGGHTVSRRFGVAPPGIDTTQILEAGLDRDTRSRKPRSDSFLALAGDDAPARSTGASVRATPGRKSDDPAPAQGLLPTQSAARSLAIDRDWRITAASPQAAAWAGSTPDDLIGTDFQQLPIPLPVFSAVKACLRRGDSRRLDAAAVNKPGCWEEFTIHGFDGGATITFKDLGDRRARHEVGAGDDLLHLLSDAASAEMALLDDRGVVVSVNAAWRETASRAGHATAGLGHRFVHVCRWISPQLDARVVESGVADLLSGTSQSFVQTSERTGPDGARWRRLRVVRLRVGADVHFVAVHEDLTEIMRAQTALRDATEQLLSAQEDERHRIAVELHDSTSQHLVAVGIGLANLRQLTARKVSTQDVIEDMSRSLKEAMKEIRVLSYLMNPPSMREALVTHARRFVRGFGARTGLQTRFSALGPLQAFDTQVQHTVFRVIQEAMANVYKHAQATNVSVSLVSRRRGLEVCIADDGHGIHGLVEGGRIEDVALGVGIVGMRSRMAQLGGQLTIESSEHGTIVTGQLPPPPKRGAPHPASREPAGDLGILQPASPGFT